MSKFLKQQNQLVFAKASEAYLAGKLNRRQFLRLCAIAGVSFTSPWFLSGCSEEPLKTSTKKNDATVGPESALNPRTDQYYFLTEMGKRFTGRKLRVVSEDTSPSKATKKLIIEEFTPLTGIEVEWELLPLDRVLAKVAADTSRQTGTHDIVYLDQAWLGRFHHDCVDPLMLFENADLAYPDYNFDDFLQPLIDNVASYQGKLVSIPYDIPIFITMYRKDLFDELALSVPNTLDEYLQTIKAINDSKAPDIYGTTASWQSGHYGLLCNMTAWLWGHGGSIFGANHRPTLNDDNAYAALEYMMELGKYMAPGVTTWDWHGESTSFAQGQAGIITSWGEHFPTYDDPEKSTIVGLAEVARCPQPNALRSAQQCGFGETPGVSHQGGSSLAISRYSKNIDVAWVFLQWATSSDVSTRACLMGGGASPIRKSNFQDPRVKQRDKVTVGTTRHFDVTLDAILKDMGTEPHFPAWPSLAVDVFAVELGKMTTGQQSITNTLVNMQKAAEDVVINSKDFL